MKSCCYFGTPFERPSGDVVSDEWLIRIVFDIVKAIDQGCTLFSCTPFSTDAMDFAEIVLYLRDTKELTIRLECVVNSNNCLELLDNCHFERYSSILNRSDKLTSIPVPDKTDSKPMFDYLIAHSDVIIRC